MNAQIKKIQNYSGRPVKRARVFVGSNATSIADDWFNKNELWSVKFKSKTWSKLGRLVNKINREAISSLLECNTKDVVYSVHCGCSCPCSPGYNVYNTNKNGKGIWVNIEADDAELKPLNDYLKIADLELQVEIIEHADK